MNFREQEQGSDEDDKSQKSSSSKDNKMLTGKYDMSVLREIARVEEGALEELVELYEVDDEDELPDSLEFDIHEFIDMPPDQRRTTLTEKLANCPNSTEEFVNKFLEKIKSLNPKLK